MLAKRMLAITVVSLLLIGSVFAQPGPGPMGPQQGPQGIQMFKALNLTDEQRSKIEDLHLEMQKKMLSMQGDLQKLEKDFRLMVIDEKVSESQLQKQLQKIHDLKLKMALERAKNHRKIRSLLNDEQKKKFDAMYLAGPKVRKAGRAMMKHRMKRNPQGRFQRP